MKTGKAEAKSENHPREWMTVAEVVDELRIGRQTVMDALRDIPGTVRLSQRCIRIPRAGLYAWMKKMEISRG